MVNKLRELIKEIKLEKGAISLCMLWKDAPEIDKWTLVVSAIWIDRLNQQAAYAYWTKKLSDKLNSNERGLISRITFLKSNDSFVKTVNVLINTINSAVHLKDTSLGNVKVTEAFIIESGQKSFVRNKDLNRNPVYNHNINPIFNHNINPIFNHNINPIFNHNINPLYNPNFDGYYLFDINSNSIGYILRADDDIMLLFNPQNSLQSYCVRNSIDGYLIYNNGNWTGNLISDGDSGYNYFSKNNEWIGYVK